MKTTSELLLEADANKPQKPTQEQYLSMALRGFRAMQLAEQKLGRPLTPRDATFRFVGRAMWYSLMGWAGMPMYLDEADE